MRRVFIWVVLISTVVAGAWAPSVRAAAPVDNSFNLITSPLPINLAGTPGSSLQAEIRVKNGGLQAEKLKVTLMKFSAYGDQGKPAIADRGPGDDYFDWVSFSPQTFDAPPNVWLTVKMTIQLPQSAAFGYYYAAVFSRAANPQPTSGHENVLVGSTAVLVLVDAQVPNAKRTAKITEFKVDKRSYEFLPANFTVKVHNSGNVHLIPSGNIFISRSGKPLATLNVNAALGNVLPNSNRVFTASWNDGFPVYATKQAGGATALDKQDKPVQNLRWDFSKLSKLRFGHYTAHLLMAYDNGQRDVPLEAVASFWVIPWRILGFGLAILALMAVGVWSIARSLIHKARKKS